MEDANQKLTRNLNTLAILQYIWAGLTFFGVAIVYVFYFVIGRVFSSEIISTASPEDEAVLGVVGGVVAIIGIVLIFFLLLSTVLKVLCGIFMQKKKNRIFCIVIASIECLNIPFGTVLGVFTIIELEKLEAKQMFDENKQIA